MKFIKCSLKTDRIFNLYHLDKWFFAEDAIRYSLYEHGLINNWKKNKESFTLNKENMNSNLRNAIWITNFRYDIEDNDSVNKDFFETVRIQVSQSTQF